LQWEIFIFGGIAALLISLLTVSFQAIKAAVANPVEALRYE
jgi:putative ABC transport system permease protein